MAFTCYKERLPNYNALAINIDIKIVNINMIDKVKYLGVYVDPNLNWNYHISFVVTSLLGKFKFFKDVLNTEHVNILYSSLVEPHLSYGILAWRKIFVGYQYFKIIIPPFLFKCSFC